VSIVALSRDSTKPGRSEEEENHLSVPKIEPRHLDRPARSPVTILTELST
jgi:hypothetical protein